MLRHVLCVLLRLSGVSAVYSLTICHKRDGDNGIRRVGIRVYGGQDRNRSTKRMECVVCFVVSDFPPSP